MDFGDSKPGLPNPSAISWLFFKSIYFSNLVHVTAWKATHTAVHLVNPRFPSGSGGKESASYAVDPGLIPGSRRSSGEGNGNAVQYSCLGNPMD